MFEQMVTYAGLGLLLLFAMAIHTTYLKRRFGIKATKGDSWVCTVRLNIYDAALVAWGAAIAFFPFLFFRITA